METIFTLIIVLLPIIFKLIGKKLEQSGAQPQHTEEQQEKPVAPVQDRESQTRQPVRKAPKKAKPILQEEEQKTTEKIDKKKLILYSEIMKPKYTE